MLPAFQAEGKVGESVGRVRRELRELAEAGDLEILVADDGSTDGTVDEARRAGADQVVVNTRNLGKGAAVKAGVTAAAGRTVAFTDVDLAYRPGQLARLLDEVEGGAPIVVGSRWLFQAIEGESTSRRWGLRKLKSRMFNLATRAAVGVWRDTQCGLKAFDAEVTDAVFRRVRQDGFAFDVEIFLAAAALGIDVVEIPVELDSRDETTVRLRGEVAAVMDLMRIRAHLRRGGYSRP